LTNAYVARLETAPSGRAVAKVHVQRNGAPETYSGDIVVVSCGAINSAALLLRSANERHPNGLANGSGVVGRHYMSHINSIYLAISKCANPTRFQKTLAVNDFYFGSKEWDYPMGHISFVGKTDGNVLAAGVAHQNGTVRFGTDPKTSALDRSCKAHELDNLYVVDGSFFPSSGAVNPALTIMANALRVGDHILERLR